MNNDGVASTGYAIEGINLWKTFYTSSGGIKRKRIKVEALRGLTVRVPRGVIYGLLGPNGAGKTTFVKIITTLLLPDKGDARVLGHDVLRESSTVRKNIGVMLSVERGFFWKLSGYENLLYFAMIYGMPRREAEERVEELLKLVGLKELGGDEKHFEDMSLGMRARLGLARALLKDPPVLILDEPTLGLDPTSARRLRNLLTDLARRQGKTILLTTHNMYEAEEICDIVGIIRKGKLVAEGSPGQLKRMVSEYYSVRVTGRGTQEVFEETGKNIVDKYSGSRYRIAAREDERISLVILSPVGYEEQILAETVHRLVDKGARITDARIIEPTLEDVFIKISGEEP